MYEETSWHLQKIRAMTQILWAIAELQPGPKVLGIIIIQTHSNSSEPYSYARVILQGWSAENVDRQSTVSEILRKHIFFILFYFFFFFFWGGGGGGVS